MAKRSISKNFHPTETLGDIYDWMLKQQLLVFTSEIEDPGHLKQKICITINLDPDHKGSMIPEGPKITNDRVRTRQQ